MHKHVCVRWVNTTEKDSYVQVSHDGHLKFYQDGKLQSPSFIVGEAAMAGKSHVMLMHRKALESLMTNVFASLDTSILTGRTVHFYACTAGHHMICFP